MFLVAGISAKIKPYGVFGTTCPACGRYASINVIHKYMTPHVFFIPTFHFHSEYIATCPLCASVMAISKEHAKAAKRDPETVIHPEDLTVLQNNLRQICGACGSRLYPGQSFCGSCGQHI